MNITWEKSIWFFDLDDTLIDTDAVSVVASKGVEKYLAIQIGAEQAKKVTDHFVELFDLLLTGYRMKSESEWQNISVGKEVYDRLVERIEKAQLSVIKQYGHAKKWSREVFVKLAADDLNMALNPGQIVAAANAYWDVMAEQVLVLPGIIELLQAIKAHSRPFYIITSSDGRLQMQPNGEFTYDPKYSEACKAKRVVKMKDKGIEADAFRIGDPEDKPYPAFFQKIITVAKQAVGDFEYKDCLMFGDSYSGDLETPQKHFGFGLVVQLDDNCKETREEEHNVVVTNSAMDFLHWFEVQQKI